MPRLSESREEATRRGMVFSTLKRYQAAKKEASEWLNDRGEYKVLTANPARLGRTERPLRLLAD